LYRVVSNLCLDRKRAQKRRPAATLEDAPDLAAGGPGVEARMMQDQRMAALNAALAELPDRQRQAVVLRHIEGRTNPQIAAILEIGVEAVESLTARGKRALTAALVGQRAALGYSGEAED
jgi:RNA polymerase sigma-70 factor (ECF subfamily)